VTDETLRLARDRVRRFEQVRRLRHTVAGQLAAVEHELWRLRDEYEAEQRDVDRLESRTFSAIVATALRNRDDRLARERAEAETARLRVAGHEARHRQLAADLAGLDRDVTRLADAPRLYEHALADAERALRDSGDPRGEALFRVTVRLADIAADLRERAEARQAGEKALAAVAAVLRPLGSAQGWSTADLFTGSLADIAEHDRLGRAQQAAWHAQQALDRFAREMADIGVHVQPRLPKVDNRWFVDMFFDNIITDAIRHQRIARTYAETEKIARRLRASIEQLDRDRAALTAERGRLHAERERLHGLA
jgi:hypothetical protein